MMPVGKQEQINELHLHYYVKVITLMECLHDWYTCYLHGRTNVEEPITNKRNSSKLQGNLIPAYINNNRSDVLFNIAC